MAEKINFTIVSSLVLLALVASAYANSARQVDADGCHMECPKSMGKQQRGASGEQSCRWILRTDGKSARLCEPAKCKKVCPRHHDDDMSRGGASSSERIEQQTEPASGALETSASSSQEQHSAPQTVGIMQAKYGNKLKQAPVPGVPGGRLAPSASNSAPQQPMAGGKRLMAPTLAPEVSYDENDTPPPISRFLDISPEE